MKISGWVWITLGIVVAIISHYSGEKLVLFFYLGLFFIAFGFFKSISKYIIGEQKRKPAQQIYRCKYCNSSTHPSFYFCPRCGRRIR